MSKTQPYRCALVFAWLLGLCFVALAGWLYRVQVVKHSHYLNIVQRMHDRPVLRVAKRGAVLDRLGVDDEAVVGAKKKEPGHGGENGEELHRFDRVFGRKNQRLRTLFFV